MSPILVFSILAAYFGLLLLTAYFTSRGSTTTTFFNAGKSSPWGVVAFGMIGASLSGVTFISVPAWVGGTQWAYFQMVLGYILGYALIAYVLMPLYYRLNLLSIYGYLTQRFGFWSHKTGSFFFLISKLAGAAARLFLAASILQLFLFDDLQVPFWVTTAITLFLIWIYTFKGGIKTIVWTDTLQTSFMLAALILTIIFVVNSLEINFLDLPQQIYQSNYSNTFFWEWNDTKNFFKQFLAGASITLTMTGLDQDMMQKNLTCRDLRSAQKNMLTFTAVLVVVKILFLVLGVLLYWFAEKNQIAIPTKSDELYPLLAKSYLGISVGVFFLVGVVAAAYSSADSALAALTTSFCVDFLNFEKENWTEQKKNTVKTYVHIGFTVVMWLAILLFAELNSSNVISAVLTMAGYTYGPLLGLYVFGLFTKRQIRDRFVPFLCVLSPVLVFILSQNSEKWFNGYKLGYELLIINSLITFAGLWLLSIKNHMAKK